MKAAVSLDLDDRWAYQKARGTADWESAPSYFDQFIPSYLQVCEEARITTTVFIVGRDADMPAQQELLQSMVKAGHEVGNHSYHHEPWMQGYDRAQVSQEIARAEEAIFNATGEKPRGWRGPGFCSSPHILAELKERGYTYDASAFPTFLGPLARLYYLTTARPNAEQREQLKTLYGSWQDGLRPLRPYTVETSTGPLLELPVSTMPLFRTPFHGSYLGMLAQYSEALSRLYFRMALLMCKARRIEPSFLLHPLDFLGNDDVAGLEFFPAMKIPGSKKRQFMSWALKELSRRFETGSMGAHAHAVLARTKTPNPHQSTPLTYSSSSPAPP